MHLELKYFKLVAVVAKEGSLAKASEKLFLTQPALSHQLKEIETQLGTKVFNRINRKLILTEAGEMMLSYSKRILGEVDGFTEEIETRLKGEVGTIRLTAESNTCFHWLPKILREHQREYPNVEFRLKSPSTKPADELLLDGQVDVAIVCRKSRDKNIAYADLFTDDVVALVPAGHPLAIRKFLTADDFRHITYITHSEHLKRSTFYEQFLKPKQVTPKKVLYIQLTETVLDMVKEGLGIAVMARWLVKPYIDTTEISQVRLGKAGLKRKWYIASLKTETTSKPLESFIEKVQMMELNS